MWEWLERLFGRGFMPHGHCYLWAPGMVWTQVTTNLLIGLAYAAIASTLAVLVRRIRNIPFAWVYWAFGTFILSCGLTHFSDVVTVWHPVYWLDAGLRVVTAAASLATAVLLVPMVPKAVAFADAARLSSERGRQLAVAHAELRKAHDLLEKRELETRRRASTSEEQFRSLVETMPQLAWISDANGTPIFRNQRWREYTGFWRDDPADPFWQSVPDPETDGPARARWIEAIKSKEPFEVEARFRRADGQYRWFLLRAVALLDAGGDVLSWMGTCTEIHDQKQLQQELLRTAEMKDEFLTTVSHELRTPLNAILGWSRMLNSGGATGDKGKKALESIERNAVAQTRLVDDLLDISRIISGKMRLDAITVSPIDAIEAAIDAVRPTAVAKGVEFRSTIERELGMVLADPWRIQQVVWNLVGNAVKFTPRDGSVNVHAARVNNQLEIVVSDTGSGINREFLPQLFTRFSQEDGSIRRNHGGLGLGLAIAKRLVELHGGDLKGDSAGEGQGATFTVTLPLAAPLATPSLPSPAQDRAMPDGQARLIGLRLLLVEDDHDSIEVVTAILSDAGIVVTGVSNAERALALLETTTFDVLISDIGLPGMDGHAFMRAVRRRPELERLPAAALTAYAYVEDRRRALEAGFQVHLRKPFDQQELFAAVGELVEIAGANRA